MVFASSLCETNNVCTCVHVLDYTTLQLTTPPRLTSIPTILVDALRNIERIDISNNNIGDEGLPVNHRVLNHPFTMATMRGVL